MSNARDEKTKQKDDEAAALLVAQSFIIFSAIYWFLQIESVRELLSMAYG
ncbi:MAG: hypothetical protein O2948_13235 [Proteobacteria bacterium]|jgi:hypothetical protein|nr:hypothetical protein [Pseudomonadota bacterium]MDA0927082.1 hypothetical protein [Pseudomonadota bacterium]